jgi:hypothetical protein
MRFFYFPTQDASIYEQHQTLNTGHDEILEIGRTESGAFRVRSLLQFNVTSISASLASREIPLDSTFELSLFIASASNLQMGQQFELYPISQSWHEGSGYLFTDLLQANDGVTWRQPLSASSWVSGGDFITDITASGEFSDPITDITVDISSIIVQWISGTIENNGIAIQFDTGSEGDNKNWGNVKFFSRQTHTIYPPVLTAKWDSQTFYTGSLDAAPTSNLLVIPSSLKPLYKKDEVARVELAVRSRYPLKTFATQFSEYLGQKYLPTSSYYSIVDNLSGNVVVPFDNASKISSDVSGSFFTFKVQNMYPLRYYRLILRVDRNGMSEFFDDGFLFTVK